MEKQKDITGAIFLVSIGILFLLNTTNIVPWSIWLQIFRFWPILLILAGIKIMLPDSRVGQIVYPIIYTIMIIFIGATSYFFTKNQSVPFLPESITNCIFNRCDSVDSSNLMESEEYVNFADYTGITDRVLSINIAASTLNLLDKDADYFLYSQAQNYTERNKPTLVTADNEGTLRTTFDNTKIHNWNWWNFKSPEYTLTLGQNTVPTTVLIQLGAGEGIVNLENATLKALDTTVGAGSLDITLRINSIPETINLEVGAGEISLTLPENVGILVSYNLGVGSIKLDDTSIDGVGKETNYKSANYDTATKKVLVTASVGVGELTIDRN
jgi:predicted membrane protein